MLSRFIRDIAGNFAVVTVVASVPLMGALAVGVDYAEMTRERQMVLNALDAAGIATARRAVEGATDAQLVAYAREFFDANLGGIDPSKVQLDVVLPAYNTGGGTLKLSAQAQYDPYFLGAFAGLMGKAGPIDLSLDARTEIRLKNTLEVALVLDNSGSMDYLGSGSGKKRMVLLKDAAKHLVDTIAAQASQMKQVDKPVQFGLVPFAASVNVGPQHAGASWMDTDGRSPIHHENFDWTTMPANRKVQLSGGIYYKVGTGWGAAEGQKVTRFTLYDDLQRVTGTRSVKTGTQWGCVRRNSYGTCTQNGYVDVYTDVPVYGPYASWKGCVEMRPHPYDKNNAAPTAGNPATLFVPMFAPDETDSTDSRGRRAMGNWWADVLTGSDHMKRQRYMPKYFEPAAQGTAAATGDQGPNGSCTTNPITPLTDVSKAAGLNAVKAAIDAMASLGATNVPEGLAWGWRVVSSVAPFTEGRSDAEKGNDKVVIVLTDGENTYYTPNSLGYNDLAGNGSIYSNYGYAVQKQPGESKGRIFMGTSASGGSSDMDNTKFTSAMNEQMTTLCTNAKAAGIIIMTVSLDLSTSDAGEKKQIDALKACASDSRFRKEASGVPAKLYWNANGSNLSDKFKEIADELSNLRIVG